MLLTYGTERVPVQVTDIPIPLLLAHVQLRGTRLRTKCATLELLEPERPINATELSCTRGSYTRMK